VSRVRKLLNFHGSRVSLRHDPLLRKKVSNPPNPPFLKGGEGGLAIFPAECGIRWWSRRHGLTNNSSALNADATLSLTNLGS